MLQKVGFKDKNKNSANPVERTLTDVDINQIKGKLNSAIDKINSTITDDEGNYLNYYTKQETENLINQQSDQITQKVVSSTISLTAQKIIPTQYINQLNFDLDTLINKIESLD